MNVKPAWVSCEVVAKPDVDFKKVICMFKKFGVVIFGCHFWVKSMATLSRPDEMRIPHRSVISGGLLGVFSTKVDLITIKN